MSPSNTHTEEKMPATASADAGRRVLQRHRLVMFVPFAVFALPAALAGQAAAPMMVQNVVTDPVPKTFYACYVPYVGTVYRIKEPGLADKCFGPSSGSLMHVPFSWTDGGVTSHGALAGLSSDDHPQYLLASGARALGGNLNASGNKITGLGAATTNGDAVRYEQAVKTGDAAGGDLGGTFPSPTVVRLQGTPVSATVPTNGQILAYDGTSWAPAAPPVSSGASGTSANTPNTLVQRDAAGGFAAGALSLNGRLDMSSIDGFIARGAVGQGSIPATGSGLRFMWYPRKAAVRAGFVRFDQWDDANIGEYSLAVGRDVTASGDFSFALGFSSIASGVSAFALGSSVIASGANSYALGARASTNGFQGAFVYGDATTSGATVTAARDHEFVVRAAGGFRFRSSASLATGCDMPAGSGVWVCTSSRDLKTDFADVDGENLLRGIASVPVTTWSYRTEDPAVKHMGPMAQDFRAAFGLGTDDTTIGLLDIAGVTFAGVKALETRTTELRAALREVESLRAEVAALRAEVAATGAERAGLDRRLTALETAIRK